MGRGTNQTKKLFDFAFTKCRAVGTTATCLTMKFWETYTSAHPGPMPYCFDEQSREIELSFLLIQFCAV